MSDFIIFRLGGEFEPVLPEDPTHEEKPIRPNFDFILELTNQLAGPYKGLNPQDRILSPQVLRLVFGLTRADPSILKEQRLVDYQREQRIEIVLLPLQRPLSEPRFRGADVAVFDLDSTLIQQEIIDELADTIGKKIDVAAITERAMRGELDFEASLRARVKLLEGVKADVWDTLKTRIRFAEGARQLCRALKRMGTKMAVYSGGFQPIADWVKEELGLDEAVANQLCDSPPTDQYPYDHLTGHLMAHVPIMTPARKAHLLVDFAAHYDVPLSNVLCVGDGANDLPMIHLVYDAGGIGIAFKAKERVQREAPNRLNTSSLVDLLYLTGRNQSYIDPIISV